MAPGSYRETVRVTGARAGLTIEADTPENPPAILGTPDGRVDGIRDDAVDGLTPAATCGFSGPMMACA